MSQEEGVSTVGDHEEKMAKERDLGYCSADEEVGAGNATKACFQTNIEENSLWGRTFTPDKHSVPFVIGGEYVDQKNYLIILEQYSIGLFLYLNGKKFHKTGADWDGCWKCKNQHKGCYAYIVTTTLDPTTAELILDRCRFEHNSRCFEYEESLEKKKIQKEIQLLLLNNLSPEAPGSLEGTQACINQRNSHGSHSTNTLDSQAGEQIKDDVDVPKEVALLLKNDSLCRITPTDDFNEPQPPAASPERPLRCASNTNSDSNISTSTQTYASILISIGLIIWIFLFIILLLHGNGFNLMLYSPMINRFTRISTRQKLSKFKAEKLNLNAVTNFGDNTSYENNNNNTEMQKEKE